VEAASGCANIYPVQCLCEEEMHFDDKLLEDIKSPDYRAHQHVPATFIYMVMEKGAMSLFERIIGPEPLGLNEIRSNTVGIAEGLDYLHNKMCVRHGDIKLENVMLVREGPGPFLRAKLIDFEYAQGVDEPPLVQFSKYYMAPEVLRNHLRSLACEGKLSTELSQLLMPGSKYHDILLSRDVVVAYVGGAPDNWAHGVILYLQLMRALPFCLSDPGPDGALGRDQYFIDAHMCECILGADYRLLPLDLPASVHSLVRGLLDGDEHRRLTAADILTSEFVTGASSAVVPSVGVSDGIVPCDLGAKEEEDDYEEEEEGEGEMDCE
jgi:serine/threonine protein kinase